MANIRQNHTRTSKRPFSGLLVRVLLIFGIISMLFIYAFEFLDKESSSASIPVNTESSVEKNNLIPQGTDAQFVDHDYYILGYNEEYEQADWVIYRLSKEELRIPNVPRAKRFEKDPDIPTGSSDYYDFSNSGFTRGHLAPAGDLAHSEKAMTRSFLMSNISPQLRGFNGGIWRELEECTRDWAFKSGTLWIAVGPVFGNVTKYIGKSSQVGVPVAFYKIIVDMNRQAGIGFLIEHEVSDRPLSVYAISIDKLEEILQLDFFDHLYEDVSIEESVEASYNLDLWPISKKRYQTRLNNWNIN